MEFLDDHVHQGRSVIGRLRPGTLDRHMLNPSIRFSPANIAALKKALRSQYPHIKSSHLNEAIAASFGFKSYAAMHPALYQLVAYAGLVAESDHLLLLLRLEELGYRNIAPEPLRRLVWNIEFPDDRYDSKTGHVVQRAGGRRRPMRGSSRIDRQAADRPLGGRDVVGGLGALLPSCRYLGTAAHFRAIRIGGGQGDAGEIADASMTGVQSKHCEANLFPR
ncbi:hypothetical protein NL154_23790 (plasmid) [Rhizobium sp. YTUHZ044]|uniref:hypothetical protein n=1 Tax=Rhizobium sp. YTUHZ044 TaxID=2962678 RepID=UPI003DA8A221